MPVIIPSLASANQSCLREEITRVDGWPYLHFDFEDGNFIDNITFGLRTVRDVSPFTGDMHLDAHLMMCDPFLFVDELAALGFRAVAIHYENLAYPSLAINRIHSLGMRAGLALNPRTNAADIAPFVGAVDYALVMTSEPDTLGQKFQPAMLEKIRALRQQSAPGFHIMVDGGIGADELRLVGAAGADLAVMGRGVFKSDDPIRFLNTNSDNRSEIWS